MLSETDNLRLLNKRISELKLKGNVVLAFDFDELVIPIHLTREVTQKVSRPIDKNLLDKLGSCSFNGILYLNSLIYEYDFKAYKKIRDKIAKETNWTEGFDKLLIDLTKKYSVIFISSGIKDICEAKLKEIKFDSRNILADEFDTWGNKIVSSNLIVSDGLKGYIVKKLRGVNYKVIAVGHSSGDKTMLENADISISVNSKIPDLAQYDVKSVKELSDVIERLT